MNVAGMKGVSLNHFTFVKNRKKMECRSEKFNQEVIQVG